MSKPIYQRILLKLSGEAFKGEREHGIDPKFLLYIANELKEIHLLGIQIGIVIGGGNIFRGIAGAANGIDRVTGDHMGMLATIMNALALQDALEKVGIPSRVQTSISMRQVAEPFILLKAKRHLEKGRIVIFGGGTGNPFFTTDTTAALRAAEIQAEALLKATKVDGVYDSDPMTNPKAKKFESMSYMDCITNRLNVMDSTALSLSMDNNLPIIVFNLNKPGNIKNIILGKHLGTNIGGEKNE
jgi:uridylate kinase